MQSGELIVSGRDKAIIHLHKFPAKVEVWFKDEAKIVPCNPHHFDSLEWNVHRNGNGYVLEIKWSVDAVREIKWNVK